MTNTLESELLNTELGLITVVAETVNPELSTKIFSQTGILYKESGVKGLIINFDGVKDRSSSYLCASFLQDIIRTDIIPIKYLGIDNEQSAGMRPDKRVVRNSYDSLAEAIASFK